MTAVGSRRCRLQFGFLFELHQLERDQAFAMIADALENRSGDMDWFEELDAAYVLSWVQEEPMVPPIFGELTIGELSEGRRLGLAGLLRAAR